ncbi:MAG: hypothetical protein JXR96_04250 [Deltaproteobacteria bacterium]|nr:hypothetical protein [Deltaproteobacteria bacterium]
MTAREVLAFELLILSCALTFAACSQKEPPEQAGTTVEYEPGEAGRSGPPPPTLSAQRAAEKAAEPVTLLVLEDRRCTDLKCQTGPVIAKLEQTFDDLRVVRHDWSSEECKRIFESEKLERLPAFLFDASAKGSKGHAKIRRYLATTGSGRMQRLRYPTDFDPRAEICDNGRDDTGDGKVDCADPYCKGKPVCRPDQPRRLEVFTMSQCPFGTRALDSMEEVLDAFERKIDFRVHFIASEKDGEFKSLHGQDEVDENIRELCAIEHYPKGYRYMKYIWCRNRKIKDKNWKACTGANGIRAETIEKCASGEQGKRLLAEDLKLAQSLGVKASPTWLANNRYLFHGIAPEAIKQELCKHNKGLEGCEKRLSSESPVPANAVCK